MKKEKKEENLQLVQEEQGARKRQDSQGRK